MVVVGLKKRDTFEEVVEYIKHPKDVIKFPDRYAKQIRNSFELSQLDGVGMMEHEQHELQTMKETEKANALRKVARNADDTSHVELKAHTEQSRPPINTTSTIQQTEPINFKIHSDTDSGYETGAESSKESYKADAIRLRDTAELEHRAQQRLHDNKLARITEQHKQEIYDIDLVWNTRHHKAQEALQRQMQISSDSKEIMHATHNKMREQRHQAEMNQLANYYKGMHTELQRYREQESIAYQQAHDDLDLAPAHKVRVVTREIANEPFNSASQQPSSSSTALVPMPPPPPKALPTPPAPSKAESLASLQSKAPPPKPVGPLATTPASNQPRPKSQAIPTRRDELIQYLTSRGVNLTEGQISGQRGTRLTVAELKAMAKTQ